MDRRLNERDDLLRQLETGLNRPFSCLKPGLFEAFESGSEPVGYDGSFLGRLPVFPHINSAVDEHVIDLCIHLQAAAHAGNAEKAQTMAAVCLRLFPEAAASHGSVLYAVISMALHYVAFEALQDALSCPVWDEKSLALLQAQLAKIDDCEVLTAAIRREGLWMYPTLLRMRELHAQGKPTDLTEVSFSGRRSGPRPGKKLAALVEFGYAAAFRWGPSGWMDANIAAYLNSTLDVISTMTATSWIDDHRRADIKPRKRSYNIRRFLGLFSLGVNDFMAEAAVILFHRRCLIIACALEKHRLRHGDFPATLEALKSDLAIFDVADPARPQQLPGFRIEGDGYLLWSAGPDANDDAGDAEKDWLWRMRRKPEGR